MRGKTMIRKAGLVLALSFALVLMMLLPNMRVEADGSMSWGEYTKKGDMNEKVGNAVTLKMGEKVSVTKGGKVTATYPYIMKFEGEAPYYEMTTGTGYLFTFDVAANKAVLVEPEMKNGGDSNKIKFLGYKISPDYDTLTWTDECYSGMAYGHDSQFVFLEKEEKVPFVNDFDDRPIRCYIFIPGDSNVTGLTATVHSCTDADEEGTIYLDGTAVADRIQDYYGKIIEVKEGEAFSLKDKTPIEVVAKTKYYGLSYPNVAFTEKVKGYLLHFTNPSGKRWILDLKKESRYNVFPEIYGDLRFTLDSYSSSSISGGDDSGYYAFVPADIEIGEWERYYKPEEIAEALEKDKVNILSWDDDFQKKIDAVCSVYPELKSKVKYINFAVASEELTPVYQKILDGKYPGYTILFPVDIGSVDKLISKAPALSSEIGFKDSAYSNSYAVFKEMGTYGGTLRSVCWQACPNGFYYNAAIAKKVLGTDDPAKVQEMISTPAKFNDVAKKMKAKGYYMTSGVNKEAIQPSIPSTTYGHDMFHALDTLLKTYDGESYDTGGLMWGERWVEGMTDGTVFGYFGTTWMLGVFQGNRVADGTMKLCEGPVSYLWGGTFVMAKNTGTQGAVANQVLTALVSDEKVLNKVAAMKDSSGNPSGDFVNNKVLNQKMIAAGTLKNSFYAGSQDATAIWHGAALKVVPDQVLTGWQVIDGKQYYYDNNGVALKGKQTISGNTYLFDATTGAMKVGWQQISNKWYFFDKATGVMKTKWYKSGKDWYYLGTDGAMQKGWQKIGKSWYLLKDGVMQTGWAKSGKYWYFFGKDGAMKTGWQKDGKKWYFFKPDGSMAANEWCKGYWLNKDGSWTYKKKATWKKDKTGWWFGCSGWYAKSQWQKIDGKWYYFDAKGYIVTGTRKIGSKTYKFNASGVCLNP